MKASPMIPGELIVNMEDKSMPVTPALEAALPHTARIFDEANEAYTKRPLAYLEELQKGQFSFRHRLGDVNCTLRPGTGSEMLVMWAGFSDGKSKSRVYDLYKYASDFDDARKSRAKPNSNSHAIKTGLTSDVLKVVDEDMPVLAIHSVIPSASYTLAEHMSMMRGDFTPAAEIMDTAVAKAQEIMHGTASETQIDLLHVSGFSLGSSNAVGSASATKHEVATVTGQEPVMVSGIGKLALKFFAKPHTGEPSELVAGLDFEEIDRIMQPFARSKVDRAGNEPIGMTLRMVQGAFKLRNFGMTHPERNHTIGQVKRLAQDVSVLMARGEGSSLSFGALNWLSDTEIYKVLLRAEKTGDKPQYAAHLVDEHVIATSLMPILHIRKYRADQKSKTV